MANKCSGPFCASPKSKGKPGTCGRPAGWGTDHPGQGRCKLHGGRSPIKTGRYSTIKRTQLADKIEAFAADDDPTNLLPELALLRALISDFIERYDAYSAALIAWHESYIDRDKVTNPKPQQVVDILAVGTFIGQIAKIAERVEKAKSEGTISLATLNRVMEQLGIEVERAADEVVTDGPTRTALLDAIERRWGTIALEPERGRQRSS